MEQHNEEERIPHLIFKNIIHSISTEEREELDKWLHADVKNQQLFDTLTDHGHITREYRHRKAIDTTRPLEDMVTRIQREFKEAHGSDTHPSAARRQSSTRRQLSVAILSAAAAIVLVAGASLFFTLHYPSFTRKDTYVSKSGVRQVVTHGSTKAMLTLENGRTIALGGNAEKNKAAIETATKDNPQDGHAMNDLATPRGGEFKVTLEDGTTVWLNAESKLTYPETFSGSERHVKVEGEAYFKVAPDKSRPFFVETSGQMVRVYGTEFNINAYAEDANVYTTLVTGSISLQPVSGGKSELILTPGHQAVFDKSGNAATVHGVDTEVVIGWRNGKFVFENQNLGQIMRTLSRWYDFTYSFRDASLSLTEFMGSVPRYGDFKDVLNILEKSGGLKFRLNGRNVVVSRK